LADILEKRNDSGPLYAFGSEGGGSAEAILQRAVEMRIVFE
jgi:hypothetical protein